MSRRTESKYVPNVTVPDVVSGLREAEARSRGTLLPALALVVVLAAWEYALPAAGVEAYLLPTPSAIAGAFYAEHRIILAELGVTLSEFAVGFAATSVSGYLLALSMAYSETLESTLYPYVVVVRSVPVVTLLPIFIIWFGFGYSAIVVISFLISFFPMVVNSLSGFKSTDSDLVEMLESFGANRREVFWNVYRYSALPSVFAGLKICTILAFTGAIVGEFLVGQAGIGYLILSYNNTLETANMFAGILTVSVTELLVFGSIHKLEGLVVDWE